MANLKTSYLGVELKNPVVVGACDLLENPENLLKIQEAGAGAIVYKSLFEEQIQLEDLELENQLNEYNNRNAEMTSLFPEVSHAGPNEFLFKLKKARETVEIPFFASLNAVYSETWVKYAKLLAEAGVDGLELNLYHVPFSFDESAEEIENKQLSIVKSVIEAVNIPVSVKLGRYYTNPLKMVKALDELGVNGVVLFNKLFQPDIDLEKEKHSTPWNLSNQDEYKLALRYAGLLSGEIDADIIGSSGISSGEEMIKLLLAGADAVQEVSTLYRNGVDVIKSMLSELESWMDANEYQSIDSFRGKLSRKKLSNPFTYKRAQYIDAMLNSERILGRPVL